MDRFYSDMYVADLEKQRNEYTAALQAFSKKQKELWQQVPYLALQADGRGGYSGQYSYAYSCGFWKLTSYSNSGMSHPYRVNCATGAICYWSDGAPEVDPHSTGLLDVSIEDIDVNRIIADLKKAAVRPYASYSRESAEKVEAWRKEMIEQYKVTMLCDQVTTKVGI
jgi:hypothetical protein